MIVRSVVHPNQIVAVQFDPPNKEVTDGRSQAGLELIILPDEAPFLIGLAQNESPFVAVIYDERTACAEGYFFDTGKFEQSAVMSLDEVTPGGAMRVAAGWAKELQAEYMIRYVTDYKQLINAL